MRTAFSSSCVLSFHLSYHTENEVLIDSYETVNNNICLVLEYSCYCKTGGTLILLLFVRYWSLRVPFTFSICMVALVDVCIIYWFVDALSSIASSSRAKRTKHCLCLCVGKRPGQSRERLMLQKISTSSQVLYICIFAQPSTHKYLFGRNFSDQPCNIMQNKWSSWSISAIQE